MNKSLNRYRLLLTFVAIFIIGVMIRYSTGENSAIWSFFGVADTASAIALAVLAFLAYKNMIKDEDDIELFFKIDEREIPTGCKLLRKDCTRSEVLGVLGMIQRKNDKRFKYNSANLINLLKEVREVQKGKKDRFFIEITEDEYKQCELPNP